MLNHVISVLFLFYLNKLHILCTTSPQIIFSYAKKFQSMRSLKAADGHINVLLTVLLYFFSTILFS